MEKSNQKIVSKPSTKLYRENFECIEWHKREEGPRHSKKRLYNTDGLDAILINYGNNKKKNLSENL